MTYPNVLTRGATLVIASDAQYVVKGFDSDGSIETTRNSRNNSDSLALST